MILAEKHNVKPSIALEELCVKTKELYNQVVYYYRQAIFGKQEYFTENEISGLFSSFKDPLFTTLPAQVAQQTIKLVFKNFNSWKKAKKEFKKNPSKFNGIPKMPSYKKKQFIVVFTNQLAKLKNGYIHFPKVTNLPPIKTKVTNLKQVRIIPQATTYTIEILYEKSEINLNLNNSNVLALDLGINNLLSAIDNVGNKPFIVNGKIIKSFNQWFNKNLATLHKQPESKKILKKIHSLQQYRKNYLHDKFHKISKYLIDYCIKNNIGTIVVGYNKGWKQNLNLGNKTNQAFVSIPHFALINKIKYKASLLGITVIVNEESYTSKCSSLDLEPIGKRESYLGKRVKRGLFKSSNGTLINADVNGAINIARKVIGDSFAKQIINSGKVLLPYRINIL